MWCPSRSRGGAPIRRSGAAASAGPVGGGRRDRTGAQRPGATVADRGDGARLCGGRKKKQCPMPIQRDASRVCGRVMAAGGRGQARSPLPASWRRCIPWLEFVVGEGLLVGRAERCAAMSDVMTSMLESGSSKVTCRRACWSQSEPRDAMCFGRFVMGHDPTVSAHPPRTPPHMEHETLPSPCLRASSHAPTGV